MENYIIDICLLIPLAWGLVRGLYRGLTLSIGSLIGLILGIYMANSYSPDLSAVFLKQFTLSRNVSYAIAYFVIFSGVTIIMFLISKLLDKFFKFVMLSWLNKLLGAIFGVFKYALVLSVCINLLEVANNYVSFIPEQKKSESILYTPIEKLVPTILPYIKFYANSNE
ncbi:MAG: CvpA family protein [Paludibacteraceae bacterium]|nr:CvpA family protein [Paludibacteraceae bacterium]